MSSASRTFSVTKEGLTRFLKVDGPSYYNGTDQVLFPFSYSNQVLDISYEGNNFEAEMVDTTGQDPGNDETNTAVHILSGPRLATSLGPNFKAYIRSWRDATIDAGSPIEVFVPPQVLLVQGAEAANVDSFSDRSWLKSTSAPASDYYPTGSVANKYYTAYVFKTPLTFTIVEGGVTKYITFRTTFDQE